MPHRRADFKHEHDEDRCLTKLLYSEVDLADISDFLIVTYERKPGRWRAQVARGCCVWIDSKPDTAKIGSADRVEAYPAGSLAVVGVPKTSGLSALTRNHVSDHPETWHIHCAGVRVGMILERSGVPQSADPWAWQTNPSA